MPGKHRGAFSKAREAGTKPTPWTPTRYRDINPFWLESQLKLATKSVRMSELLVIARSIRAELYAWVDSYDERNPQGTGFIRFQLDWVVVRLVMSLQLRLVVEQILWEKDIPWRRLCTGFKPVGSA